MRCINHRFVLVTSFSFRCSGHEPAGRRYSVRCARLHEPAAPETDELHERGGSFQHVQGLQGAHLQYMVSEGRGPQGAHLQYMVSEGQGPESSLTVHGE